MKNVTKTFGLISLMVAVSGANAAVSRVSMTQNPARRLPSVSGWVVSNGTTTTSTATTTTNSSTAVFSDVECIDVYTACLKSGDVCGNDMEECTTNVLLHAKMPNCLSTLYQCSSSGINSLFGTSSVTALSNVAEKNSYGEVTRYTYPTDGSVLGQMVIGANLSNKLSMDQCVRKYTNCLKRDSVCGENFELCTSYNEFRKQSINCASTLARCQSDGLVELFGSANTNVAPHGDSRIGIAITEGAAYAAANAVNTCYKVIDACLVNACTANPWRCVEGVNTQKLTSADFVAASGENVSDTTSTSTLSVDQNGSVTSDFNLYTSTGQDVRKFIKGKCLATIGGNKACYMTFLERMPKERDLADIDNQEDVFSMGYAARKEFANSKIQDILKTFDTRAKTNCIKTISNCARASCARGVGSVCYTRSRQDDGIHVNNENNYNDIKTGCEAVVNMDANCQYAANSASEDGYIYQYIDNSVFTTLFPQYNGAGALTTASADPIGAVASLNALLSSSYNDAAIARLKKECTSVATGCIKSMCGTDYTNCYRNRTDIISGVYNTGTGLDKSMNKMGGILDYNIVTGLCVDMVKNSKSCEEHLKIEAAGITMLGQTGTSWEGASSVRDSWMDVGSSIGATQSMVTVGCTVSEELAKANSNCDIYTVKDCNTVDDAGCAYTEEYKQGIDEYTISYSAKSLLQKLLMDVEKEAQAKYNAKLTKEQNVCLAQNKGGIMGASDMGSTFQWSKLKNGKVPSNYSTKGLTTGNFVASNELYGSFCNARITVLSNDKTIQDNLGDQTRYFAVGDPFTCGSWITQATLDKITKKVGDKARKDAGEGSAKEKAWTAALPWIVGTASAVGGFAGMDAIQTSGSSLGGIFKNSRYNLSNSNKQTAKNCLSDVEKAKLKFEEARSYQSSGDSESALGSYRNAVSATNKALSEAKSLKDLDTKDRVTSLDKLVTPSAYTISSEWNSEKINAIRQKATDLRTKTCAISDGSTKNLCTGDCSSKLNNFIGQISGNVAKLTAAQVQQIWDDIVNQCDDTGCTTSPCSQYISIDVTDITKDGNNGLNFADYENVLENVEKVCREHEQEANDGNTGRIIANSLAGAATGVAGYFVAKNVQKSVREAKYEAAEKEAIEQWMSEIGDKIKCYLGGEELGSYGDMISFEIE